MTEQEAEKLKATVENLFKTCEELQEGFTRLTNVLIQFDQRIKSLESEIAKRPKLIKPHEVNGRFHA